jgi:hypothetical protein
MVELGKVKAAAWGADGALYAVVDREGKRFTALLREGRVVEERQAVPKANRIVVLPSGAVLTTSRDGKGKLVAADGTMRTANFSMGVEELVVCHGVAYAAGGRGRQLGRFDEATATWSSTGLRAAMSALLPEEKGATDGVEAIVAGKAGPIVAVNANSRFRVLVMEFDGQAWRQRADLPHRCNAIAFRADQDVVYSVGDEVIAIDSAGAFIAVGTGHDLGLWSAGWARGELFAGSLRKVTSFDVRTGTATERLPAGEGEVPHNHSLFVSGDQVAFVRGGQLIVLP